MKRVLPPILFIALALPMFGLLWLDPYLLNALHRTGIPFWEVAISAALGLTFLVGGRLQFKQADAEIMTFNKPRNLVTTGLFKISRNPMYLGFLLLLLAAALYVNVWQALLGPLVFFGVANWWYIPAEEAAASEVFGDSYLQYKRRVRRWL